MGGIVITRGTAKSSLIVARELAGLSQRELARKSGVSHSRIQRLEHTGEIDNVPYLDAVAIATTLGLSVHAIMDQNFVDRLQTKTGNPALTPAFTDTLSPAWVDPVMAPFALHPAWCEMPNTLGKAVRVLSRHRPDLQGMGLLVRDGAKGSHTLYYGDVTGGDRVTAAIDRFAEGLQELLKEIRNKKCDTQQIANTGTPYAWCPPSWRPCWVTYRVSACGC